MRKHMHQIEEERVAPVLLDQLDGSVSVAFSQAYLINRCPHNAPDRFAMAEQRQFLQCVLSSEGFFIVLDHHVVAVG
jgi:hypothetical protein